ncbi:PDR/VanB family oxidoreductase [Leifsonia kafniensis]|uniref:PDR/VanB family oxidoreductase n=1 Tax=Leifsonia kafniensis TaxID=475957 RepID=A0ABP7KMJ7_9MICO
MMMSLAPTATTDDSVESATSDLQLRVTALIWESPEVLSVHLRSLDGSDLPQWDPGAHIDITFENDMQRQYSLTGDPADSSSWRLTVAHSTGSRGASRHVHTELRPGAIVRASAPRNNFSLIDAPGYVLIGGGIGVTPLLTFARTLQQRGADWRLDLATRGPEHVPLRRDLEQFGDRVHIYAANRGQRLSLAEIIDQAPAGYALYCCGPERMLDEFDELCAAREISAHRERFAAQELSAPIRSGAFTVTCARSGREIVVEPEVSVLTALESAGLPVTSSCLEGVCGTCEVAVLAGIVDHRDSILTADERDANDTMMTCVSRALSDNLELDL